jgi:hypothetical protein
MFHPQKSRVTHSQKSPATLTKKPTTLTKEPMTLTEELDLTCRLVGRVRGRSVLLQMSPMTLTKEPMTLTLAP